jgi:hypothetical protein
VTNNSLFLILLERSVPNLAGKVLRLTLDWASHRLGELSRRPVLVMETFVETSKCRPVGGTGESQRPF